MSTRLDKVCSNLAPFKGEPKGGCLNERCFNHIKRGSWPSRVFNPTVVWCTCPVLQMMIRSAFFPSFSQVSQVVPFSLLPVSSSRLPPLVRPSTSPRRNTRRAPLLNHQMLSQRKNNKLAQPAKRLWTPTERINRIETKCQSDANVLAPPA